MSTDNTRGEFLQGKPNGAEAPRLKIVGDKIADVFDDLANLVCSQDFSEAGSGRKLLTHIPVRRPRVTDWFAVNPDPAYRAIFHLCEDKTESETFLVTPQIAAVLDGESTLHIYTIFTAINRPAKTVFLFPIRQPGRDGKWNQWHRSQQEAAELAMRGWLRMIANKDAGAYDLLEATGNFAAPDWSDLPPFPELVRVAFRDFLIDDVAHPHLKRLRGEA